MESNNLLSNTQHGFQPKLSTETALIVITDNIYSNMDAKKVSLLTLCDLSKAFDSVSPEILLSKCAELHIDNFWFKSYMNERSQSVRLSNTLLNKINVQETEETLYNMKQYFLLNGLMLNSKKTRCILIGNRQQLSYIPLDTFINCDSEHIYPSTHVKNLCVFIDRYMLFDVHISEVSKKSDWSIDVHSTN